ncbi:ABC transporter substrate-binding protein [Amphritea pacifica]|uniref:ABC transporter substrate-binding protein n=1 Tax=Amphritea pacifica TaxID=2811233 RepID=A0ABS2W9N6_9GAMM|nr:ABC transporter substrate-binding protein [Amphritea pacifica]MBN0988320.1 ABC transporter substrate-binding protein [Amphritea pacifica]MBN1005569.1 ABC transporter substrate-binding protein [Amphritea pacifica]
MIRQAMLALVLMICNVPLQAETLYDLPASEQPASQLRIYGAADYPAIAAVLQQFQKKYPRISVHYTEFNTRVLYQRFLEEQPHSVDLVLSSAMDLQIKLVNDGYAQPHLSLETERLPRWANWRNEIFGFTYEPAVIAINSDVIKGEDLPRSRSELLSLIRRKSDLVKGRIGTFDIERVGVGYLTWANDRKQSGSYGRLLESFGTHQARRFPSSSSMLKALASGEIVIAYNLMGSYALAAAKKNPVIKVIMPEDYTALVMRSAFIPRKAQNLHNARLFLNYLLSLEGQQLLADRASLFPIRDDVTGMQTAHTLLSSSQGRFQPIPLGLALLVHTDQAKRRLILDEWDAAMKSVD